MTFELFEHEVQQAVFSASEKLCVHVPEERWPDLFCVLNKLAAKTALLTAARAGSIAENARKEAHAHDRPCG